MRTLLGLFLSALTMHSAAQSALPELKTHLDYAKRCASAGYTKGLNAALEAIAPEKLTIYLDAQSFTEEDRRVWGDAQDAWSRAIGVSFEMVKTPEAAQITVIGATSLEVRGRSAAGYTFWTRGVDSNHDGVLTGQVFLASHAGGRALSYEARRHAAMHEIGHLLGLDDSRRVGDVMGPLDPRRPALRPGGAELKVLQGARTQAQSLLFESRQTL